MCMFCRWREEGLTDKHYEYTAPSKHVRKKMVKEGGDICLNIRADLYERCVPGQGAPCPPRV